MFLIEQNLETSYDNSEFVVIVFDDDRFCNGDDDQSIKFDDEIYKSTKLSQNLTLEIHNIKQDRRNFNPAPNVLK